MQKPEILDSSFDKYLGKFSRYNDLMEDFLLAEFWSNEKHNNFIENTKKLNLDDDKERELFFDRSREYVEKSIFYPQSFRKSLLIQIFSVLEHNLIDLCIYHHHKMKTDFSVKDLRGNSDIEKCKLYLKKSCKIDFKLLDPEWNFIENIRKIRNLIVHNKSEITLKHKNWNTIFQFVLSNKSLVGFSECIEYMEKKDFQNFHRENSSYHIEISERDLNKKLIENINSFFIKLQKEISIK